jgi:hypothetical protein
LHCRGQQFIQVYFYTVIPSEYLADSSVFQVINFKKLLIAFVDNKPLHRAFHPLMVTGNKLEEKQQIRVIFPS